MYKIIKRRTNKTDKDKNVVGVGVYKNIDKKWQLLLDNAVISKLCVDAQPRGFVVEKELANVEGDRPYISFPVINSQFKTGGNIVVVHKVNATGMRRSFLIYAFEHNRNLTFAYPIEELIVSDKLTHDNERVTSFLVGFGDIFAQYEICIDGVRTNNFINVGNSDEPLINRKFIEDNKRLMSQYNIKSIEKYVF